LSPVGQTTRSCIETNREPVEKQLSMHGTTVGQATPSYPSRSLGLLVLPECSVTAWVSEVKKLRFVFYKKPENNLISTLFPYKKILSSFPSVFCWRVDDSKRQTVAVTIGQSGLESDYLALKPSSTIYK